MTPKVFHFLTVFMIFVSKTGADGRCFLLLVVFFSCLFVMD